MSSKRSRIPVLVRKQTRKVQQQQILTPVMFKRAGKIRQRKQRQHLQGNIPGPLGVQVQNGVASSSGVTRVTNHEYWGTLTATTGGTIKSLLFNPGQSGMLVLDGLGKVYDNYRVHRAVISISGFGPTTSSAILYSCLDYEPGALGTTAAQILTTVPNVTLPAYRDGKLIANKQSMMRRNWLVSNVTTGTEDATAFGLTTAATGTTTDLPNWLVYCDYDVEFRNPSKAGG